LRNINFILNVNINIGAVQNQEGMKLPDEKLNDVIKGKKQPWRSKKKKSIKLAEALHALKHHKKAHRVFWCSDVLGFKKNDETGQILLKTAQFCRERLCVMCSWRKSIKMFYQLSRVMDAVQDESPDMKPIFLTLTVRNCKGEDLSGVLDMMFKGWKAIIDHRRVRGISKGWFRALEVTYNRETDTYHPHFHALIMVEKSYFSSSKFLHTVDWVHIWGNSCKLDYDPICDIRAVRTDAPKKYKHVAEVAKYTVKDTDYIFQDEAETIKVVEVLGQALKGRRLFAFGGVLKNIAKQLKAEDLGSGDLINISEDAEMREEIADVLILYKWDFGLSDYIRQDR